ncbi:MAG TPA: hypothetical protein VGS41_16855 [Chthonomonadales bacterium]|nr:hypothetical protein [Chthonomonadales bacterium]
MIGNPYPTGPSFFGLDLNGLDKCLHRAFTLLSGQTLPQFREACPRCCEDFRLDLTAGVLLAAFQRRALRFGYHALAFQRLESIYERPELATILAGVLQPANTLLQVAKSAYDGG